jgi:hypothetical protein
VDEDYVDMQVYGMATSDSMNFLCDGEDKNNMTVLFMYSYVAFWASFLSLFCPGCISDHDQFHEQKSKRMLHHKKNQFLIKGFQQSAQKHQKGLWAEHMDSFDE